MMVSEKRGNAYRIKTTLKCFTYSNMPGCFSLKVEVVLPKNNVVSGLWKGLGEPGTTELGITCKSGIRYNGIGYNGIRHNEVSSKQESGIT